MAGLKSKFGRSKPSKPAARVDTSGLNPSANRASVDKPKSSKRKRDEFEPFPVDLLPEVLQRFVTEAAAAIGCDPTMAVMPALAVCAAAIGTSRSLMIKHGWFVPSVLWTVVIGESGSQKSPPFRMATEPLKIRQSADADRHNGELQQYGDDLADYKRDLKRWERNQEGDAPERPQKPVRNRCILSDITIEALARILQENPRGVLTARDELSGWLASFDKYGKGGSASSDVQRWLEIYNTESITIDRKTGDDQFVHVKRPAVSITGGIQPDILSKCLTDEHKSNGLQSRLLMAYPPRQAKRWRDDEVSDAVVRTYHDAVGELFTLKPSTGDDGNESPALLRLTDHARSVFKAFVNSHGDEQNGLHGHLASQWSKLEEIPARLAIILHCVRQVTTGVEDHFEVDDRTMTAAVAITEWFKTECLRINRLLVEPVEAREAQHLIDWIRSRGGSITARELHRNRRDIESSDEAETMLIYLASINAGTWDDIHNSRIFVLSSTPVDT